MKVYCKNLILVRLVFISIFICIISTVGATAPKVQYKFQFNPPNGISYITTCKSTKVVDNGATGKQVDVSISKEQIQITKTENGYLLVPKTLSVEMTRNGGKLPAAQEASMQALAKISLPCSLDANGKLTSVNNTDELYQVIDAMLKDQNFSTPDKLAELRESIKTGVVDNIASDWNNRIVGFTGKTVNAGDIWKSQQEIGSSFGNVNVTMKTYFGNPVIANKHNCLKIGFAYVGDKNSIKQLMTKIMETISKTIPAGYPAPQVINATISGKGSRIIDPSTMLIYSDEVSRTMTMTLRIAGMGDMPTTFSESKIYRYDYLD
ncbi:hypothetical protein [uncultured Desulfobulbus sp.]|uniref:hypothetical protein n=1 Tax=uncultured Desulfobulbus sp. TaxID=239745 RepID=UPI0029C82A49|nr:hypothetical protein [uncultured Desulfobulbus sp.]